MAEPKFTPGPWVFEGRGPNMKVFFAAGNRLSPCFLADGNQEANAHLIAAAPDLYEALQKWVTIFCEVAAGADDENDTRSITEAFNRSRAILAKARGEAS